MDGSLERNVFETIGKMCEFYPLQKTVDDFPPHTLHTGAGSNGKIHQTTPNHQNQYVRN